MIRNDGILGNVVTEHTSPLSSLAYTIVGVPLPTVDQTSRPRLLTERCYRKQVTTDKILYAITHR